MHFCHRQMDKQTDTDIIRYARDVYITSRAKNRLIFGIVTDKNLVSWFIYDSQCSLQTKSRSSPSDYELDTLPVIN